ncbi:phosphotransferase family protein [Aeromicrobium yanjiei]|uniref:Phosphotransferase n=1 Tax=Aeromicrobium yanjiei TaxID=2662028 RepID=A0A5Q2MIE8_9ACTN|nr:phosphotransferase family protein [Aeromicrobium yanjiei]QGG41559.1 phosphotransferase [Aeromicrobium yanjiei]
MSPVLGSVVGPVAERHRPSRIAFCYLRITFWRDSFSICPDIEVRRIVRVGHVSDELLLDITARAERAVAQWSEGSAVENLRPLTGGASSLTFVLDVVGGVGDGDEVVLKVAPPGLPPLRNRDVLRQARLFRALEGQEGVLVPRALFEDAGDPPEIPPFFAMSMVPGECVEPNLASDEARPSPDVTKARSFDAMEVLAALHRVSPAAVGLGDEPVVTLGDEIDRWTRAFETVPTELSGDYARAARALHATVPEAMAPVVNHGDYRLGNTLCEGGRLTAIIDWEIWSLGDPRIDMTWFTFFTDEAQHPAVEPGVVAGTPTRQELIRAYETAADATLADLPWFDALTKYKEAAATALLIKRDLKSGGMSISNGRMLPALPRLVQEALDIVG